MALKDSNPTLEQEDASSHYDIADNGSIILGWMLIGIMVLFGALSVALYEAPAIEVVDNTPVGITEEIKPEHLKRPDAQPAMEMDTQDNLIHTRITI